jgi:ketosteroid isomerase-like protein
MRKRLVVSAVFAIALSPVGVLAGPNEDAVMNADRGFNAMAQQRGVAAAFAAYAAPNALLFERLPEPIRGPEAIGKFMAEGFTGNAKLTWEPREATASRDGTMGTTWGRWTFTDKDEEGRAITLRGTYVTVWQKQGDGSWKFTHDLDQADLPPPPPPQSAPPAPKR